MKSAFFALLAVVTIFLIGAPALAHQTGQERTNLALVKTDPCPTGQSFGACRVNCPHCNDSKLDQPSAVVPGSSNREQPATGNQ